MRSRSEVQQEIPLYPIQLQRQTAMFLDGALTGIYRSWHWSSHRNGSHIARDIATSTLALRTKFRQQLDKGEETIEVALGMDEIGIFDGYLLHKIYAAQLRGRYNEEQRWVGILREVNLPVVRNGGVPRPPGVARFLRGLE